MSNTNRSAARNTELTFDRTELRAPRCAHCAREVETVNDRNACEGCEADRDAADERDCEGVSGCDTCGGYGVVRSYRMSPEADCDLVESEPANDDCDDEPGDIDSDECFNPYTGGYDDDC